MSVKRYDKNYKIEVVCRAISKDKTVPDLAKEHSIHENTIYKWIGEFKKDEAKAVVFEYIEIFHNIVRLLLSQNVKLVCIQKATQYSLLFGKPLLSVSANQI